MNQQGCVPPARLAGAAAVAAKAAALRRLGFGGLRGGLQHRAPLNQAQKMEKSRAPATTKCPVAWHEAVCTSQAAFAWSPTTPALKVKRKVISLSYHGPYGHVALGSSRKQLLVSSHFRFPSRESAS